MHRCLPPGSWTKPFWGPASKAKERENSSQLNKQFGSVRHLVSQLPNQHPLHVHLPCQFSLGESSKGSRKAWPGTWSPPCSIESCENHALFLAQHKLKSSQSLFLVVLMDESLLIPWRDQGFRQRIPMFANRSKILMRARSVLPNVLSHHFGTFDLLDLDFWKHFCDCLTCFGLK